ncbi:MAG: transcription termination factor Rho, partial [Bacteroidetes bacterium]
MAEKTFDGILELIGEKKFGFIREFRPDLPKGKKDAFVSPGIIKKYNLRDGMHLEGTLRPGRKGDMQVHHIDRAMGEPIEAWSRTYEFETGRVIFPEERIKMNLEADNTTLRCVDLAVPIGKGQRVLIVAPP